MEDRKGRRREKRYVEGATNVAFPHHTKRVSRTCNLSYRRLFSLVLASVKAPARNVNLQHLKASVMSCFNEALLSEMVCLAPVNTVLGLEDTLGMDQTSTAILEMEVFLAELFTINRSLPGSLIIGSPLGLNCKEGSWKQKSIPYFCPNPYPRH